MADGDKKEWKPDPKLLKEEEELIKQYQSVDGKKVLLSARSLDDFWAYLPEHKYIFIPNRKLYPNTAVNSVLRRVQLRNRDGSALTDEKGKQKSITASGWLDRNRAVDGLVWAPDEPEIIDGLFDEGGPISYPGLYTYNLYRPPPQQPGGDPDAVGPWRDHLDELYPDEANEIIIWLAHLIQYPGIKINHVLVLGGAQGIGKDTLLEPVKRALGAWNVKEITPTQMMEPFNPFLQALLVCINEGRDLGDQDRYKYYDHTKTVTTIPPNYIRINDKYRPAYYIQNRCSLITTTNYLENGLYLPEDDRRHFVCWSTRTREDFSPEYFPDLWSFINDGGDLHVAAFLLAVDLTGFDPKAPPRVTAAHLSITQAYSPPESADMAAVLGILRHPVAITIAQLALTAAENGMPEFADWLRDRKNGNKVSRRLEDNKYLRVPNPDDKTGYWHNRSNVRIAIYGFKEYTARERLAAARQISAIGA